jgi:hypothetical protein
MAPKYIYPTFWTWHKEGNESWQEQQYKLCKEHCPDNKLPFSQGLHRRYITYDVHTSTGNVGGGPVAHSNDSQGVYCKPRMIGNFSIGKEVLFTKPATGTAATAASLPMAVRILHIRSTMCVLRASRLQKRSKLVEVMTKNLT